MGLHPEPLSTLPHELWLLVLEFVPRRDYSASSARRQARDGVSVILWSSSESGVFDGGNSTNPDLDHLVQARSPGRSFMIAVLRS